MHLSENALKGAAKRYARKHSIPLHEASEEVAKLFGFRNAQAARTAVVASAVATRKGVPQAPTTIGPKWNGLDAQQTVRAILNVVAQSEVEPSVWTATSKWLSACIVEHLFATCARTEVTTSELIGAFKLPGLIALWGPYYDELQSNFDAVSRPIRAIHLYLTTLPAFDVTRGEDQRDVTQEQHVYTMMAVLRAVTYLSCAQPEVLEKMLEQRPDVVVTVHRGGEVVLDKKSMKLPLPDDGELSRVSNLYLQPPEVLRHLQELRAFQLEMQVGDPDFEVIPAEPGPAVKWLIDKLPEAYS